MIVGVPTEIKKGEQRVGLVPSSVHDLIDNGHQVLIQAGAGEGAGLSDEYYMSHGAEIVPTAADIFERADMVVKVKEPQPEECKMLREDQVLFTYLHLAPDPVQTKGLVDSGCTAIAYETVTDARGGLPLLTPMSEVAGRISIQAGAHCLERAQGGRGILLGGVPGVERARVVIIGGGVVGTNAMRMAMGSEANVVILDTSVPKLRELDVHYGSRIKTIYATQTTIDHFVRAADLVICAVLIPGASAPKLISRELISKMKPGAVIVDVSIDQGGCMETSRPTTFSEPTFIVDDVVHYCVANMPGAVPRTAAFALNNVTLPFVRNLANKGARDALLSDPHFLNGLNVHRGKVTYEAVARDLGYEYVPADIAIQE